MATIALNRLSGRAVEIIRDGKAEYFTSVSNLFITSVTGSDGLDYINVVFKEVPAQNRTVQLKVADITTINTVAKPALTSDLVKLLATDVFSILDATGGGVTQAYVDNAVSNLQTQVNTNSSSISTLNGQMSTANTNISTNTSSISTLNGQMTTANNNIATNASNITGKTSPADVDAKIATYDATVVATYKRKDRFIDFTASLDFPSIPAQSVSAGIVITNANTTNITANFRCIMNLSGNMNKALSIYGICGSNLVTFYAINPTAAAIDNINGTYQCTAINAG